MKKPELLPDIEAYLEQNLPISTVGLERIEGAILAKTKLNEFNSKEILRLFFQEIRNELLKKSIIDFRSLGSFYISSPALTNNSKKIFVKFKAKKSLLRKLNG